MKTKITLFIVLFFISFSNFSQDMKSLKKEVFKTYTATTSMDYDAIFDTTYPKVFDIIPKESMKEMFEQMMDNEQFTIQLVEVEPNFSFGEIKTIGTQKFCLIDHDNVMMMKFKTPMEDAEAMTDIFKKSMDAMNVTFDKEKNEFKIEMRSTLIAVSDELTGNQWKFLNKDKENQLFNMIFDEKIKTELGL
ncbi:hypothetical protein GOQ30_17215 [Flavobacterium sp. TP390]|uniref:DUF4468 domain-containing protein n=1 Tax=Flavobacterium profundi TaxID=1774945 RepID=A0A6I4IVI3_9FLAO|nr:hypothetical protein [Flavobacterium profundi]MVO10914.1 hypothetical protein [Flavobacterium profundi]